MLLGSWKALLLLKLHALGCPSKLEHRVLLLVINQTLSWVLGWETVGDVGPPSTLRLINISYYFFIQLVLFCLLVSYLFQDTLWVLQVLHGIHGGGWWRVREKTHSLLLGWWHASFLWLITDFLLNFRDVWSLLILKPWLIDASWWGIILHPTIG